MSTSVSSLAAADVPLALRAASAPVTSPSTAQVPGKRPILISPVSGPLPSGVDPMALFDSLLVSVDIRGPQILRSSRYAAQIYQEMQRLLMRLY